jgi:hypothetical protein
VLTSGLPGWKLSELGRPVVITSRLPDLESCGSGSLAVKSERPGNPGVTNCENVSRDVTCFTACLLQRSCPVT